MDTHRLLALNITTGVNKSGTASIQMPPDHPALDAFTIFKTVVTIYRGGVLLFRGRALDVTEDFYKRRTITCEGERGFFQDGITRPYLYQDTPAAIFSSIVADYNAQVDDFKRFEIGAITVTDANNYVRLESTKAEQTADVLDKLIERCGGYITFSTNSEGKRAVNWLAELAYRNNQTIEFGQNLTDYVRLENADNLATRIVPYGAKDELTEDYLTIETVNDGVDYVEDAEAVALRGVITKAVYWDDVTDPTNLLRKAREYLGVNRSIITSLELSAVDLSALDKSLDTFRTGDLVRVISRPHRVDEYFVVMDKDEDLLVLGDGSVTMGKEKKSLTGLGADKDRQTADNLQKVERDVRAEYLANLAVAIKETKSLLSSLIEQASDAIRLEVSETYMTNGEVDSAISTQMEQLSDSFTFSFSELKATMDELDETSRAHITEQQSYIRFEDGNIILGREGAAITLTLENNLIVFKKNGEPFGSWDGTDFRTGNIIIDVDERAQFGNFAFVPRGNGSLSFLKVGG
jgi:hypothetical protein